MNRPPVVRSRSEPRGDVFVTLSPQRVGPFLRWEGIRGRGWRVVILKCVEKLGTGEEVKSGRARDFEIQVTG
jgi:hypothetical protein